MDSEAAPRGGGVDVGVSSNVGVAVGHAPEHGVSVAVGVGVLVPVGAAVLVGVGVGVSVGQTDGQGPTSMLPWARFGTIGCVSGSTSVTLASVSAEEPS